MLGASQLLNGPTNGQTLDEPPVERSYSLGESWSGGGASTASARDSLASKLAEQRGPGSRATRRGGFAGAVGGFVRTARARARSGPGAGAPSTPRRPQVDLRRAGVVLRGGGRVHAREPRRGAAAAGARARARRVLPRAGPGDAEPRRRRLRLRHEPRRRGGGPLRRRVGRRRLARPPRSKNPSRETAGRVATPLGTRPSASSSSSSTTCAPAARPRPV